MASSLPTPGVPAGLPELPTDYRRLELPRIWRGREQVTRVEGSILQRAAGERTYERALELGAGHGRLTPYLSSKVRELVALDAVPEFLGAVPLPEGEGRRGLRVVGNAYHLPFSDQSFSLVVLVRVYNFLTDPRATLAEIHRVLAPGGRVVLSCHPHPTAGTLFDDLRFSIRGDSPQGFRPLGLSRAELLPVPHSRFPAWTPTRRRLRQTLEEAGLRPVWWGGTGFEEYRGLRALPSTFFVAAGAALASSGLFPMLWVAAESGGGTARPLPEFASILACPRCRRGISPFDPGRPVDLPCPRCGFELVQENGILRAFWTSDPPKG